MPLQTIIKICGITQVEQALACAEMGIQWLGFNCYEPSSRYVSPAMIRSICQRLKDSIETVGIFVNMERNQLLQIMQTTGLKRAQLHGEESVAYAHSLSCSWYKAFRISATFQPADLDQYKNPLFLLDSSHRTLYGGTGTTFDWSIAQAVKDKGKLILAGGIRPENAVDAIRLIKPYALDIASGVESSPGIKDLQKVKQLIHQVQVAEIS